MNPIQRNIVTFAEKNQNNLSGNLSVILATKNSINKILKLPFFINHSQQCVIPEKIILGGKLPRSAKGSTPHAEERGGGTPPRFHP